MDPTLLALLLVAVGGGLVISGLGLGTWLRGGAAEQAERRHAAERAIDALRLAGLEAQLADARAGRANAERARDVALAEVRARGDALSAGGEPAADRVLLDLGPGADATARPADPAGGLSA